MRRHRSSWSHCSDWRPERTQRSSRLGATLPAEVAGAMWRMRMERGAARSTGSLMVTPSGSLLLISPFKLFPPPFLDSFSFSPPFFCFYFCSLGLPILLIRPCFLFTSSFPLDSSFSPLFASPLWIFRFFSVFTLNLLVFLFPPLYQIFLFSTFFPPLCFLFPHF